jgi:hypothetical protein
MIKLSVCVLSYEGKDVLEECLNSIYAQKCNFKLEVIVTDNGSTDGTHSMVESNFPSAKLYVNKQNNSFTSCYNSMISASHGALVAIVSNDIVFEDIRCFEKIISIFSENENIGMVAPKSVRPDGTVDIIRKTEQTFYDIFKNYTLLGVALNKLTGNNLKETLNQDESGYSEVLQDSSIFINKSAISKNSAFNENLKFYYTEDQLSLNVRKNGFGLYYVVETQVRHHHQFTMKKASKLNNYSIYFKDAMRYSLIYHNKLLVFGLLYPLGYISYVFRVIYWSLTNKS